MVYLKHKSKPLSPYYFLFEVDCGFPANYRRNITCTLERALFLVGRRRKEAYAKNWQLAPNIASRSYLPYCLPLVAAVPALAIQPPAAITPPQTRSKVVLVTSHWWSNDNGLITGLYRLQEG